MKSYNFVPKTASGSKRQSHWSSKQPSSLIFSLPSMNGTAKGFPHSGRLRGFGRFGHSDDADSSATSRTNRKRLIFAVQ